MDRSLDLLVAQLAIGKCAAVYVPLDINAPSERQAFMVADSLVTQGGRGALWRRGLARGMLFVSLGFAAALDPEQLTFVIIVLPVFVLFFAVHGLMGRWVARRAGAVAAGLGLGLCLAWALGVSFPLFS